jgi:hypothetical protein
MTIGFLIVVLTAAAIRVVLPPYVNLSRALAEGNYSSGELFREFTADPNGSYRHLAGKVIIIEGAVFETGNGFVRIGQEMAPVRCLLRKTIYDRNPYFKTGDCIILKGVCQGLDMTEVIVTHCITIKGPEH